ncbi:unnamed protein product [Hymenolepis diminuta]|uniref:Uncharacterized protein n=1 Tax=Hymenolepis diminuta TaxID=6216 RepID=A0A564Z234_HYMDI|nr:unnamed protein product [Hymenolepis diminuta]
MQFKEDTTRIEEREREQKAEEQRRGEESRGKRICRYLTGYLIKTMVTPSSKLGFPIDPLCVQRVPHFGPVGCEPTSNKRRAHNNHDNEQSEG